MKVLVTGGAGFIGSHIVEYWLSQGAEVIVIDNFRSSNPDFIKKITNVKFYEYSIEDYELIEPLFKDVNYVHHLAAMVSVPESIDNPFECVNINIKGLLNVLNACKKHNVKKIVHSSSAAIYGENPITPKTTNLKPEPKSPYGITKLDGEYYLDVYRENFNVNGVSLRYFNVYGPRQNPKSQYAAAIPIFISKALKNEDIIIYGDGQQTRDFVYIKDVVKANVLAVTSDKYGVFNVGTGTATSINDIVNNIIKITESKSKVVYAEPRKGDIKDSLSSIETTKKELGYFPDWKLEDGLRETIEYFKSII
jgi:UDP-glucose 4-epimerase